MALCGVQLGVQIRLGLPGDVLGTAKRVSALIRSVPGLVRCAGCCALQGDDFVVCFFRSVSAIGYLAHVQRLP